MKKKKAAVPKKKKSMPVVENKAPINERKSEMLSALRDFVRPVDKEEERERKIWRNKPLGIKLEKYREQSEQFQSVHQGKFKKERLIKYELKQAAIATLPEEFQEECLKIDMLDFPSYLDLRDLYDLPPQVERESSILEEFE